VRSGRGGKPSCSIPAASVALFSLVCSIMCGCSPSFVTLDSSEFRMLEGSRVSLSFDGEPGARYQLWLRIPDTPATATWTARMNLAWEIGAADSLLLQGQSTNVDRDFLGWGRWPNGDFFASMLTFIPKTRARYTARLFVGASLPEAEAVTCKLMVGRHYPEHQLK
jgi:hypothetical protein